ncbi:uncharacterized protein LOC127278862 [Leptopilina boulardi]|uniref:uncharacterized protein LOC127278862 n=1 Tax=Leptopilina boulardi TaxID=63433 RepID=UPI0021F56FC1|nr:uncharacterized protein LOC127278862 [Leptopilina boulardi]
MGEKLEVPKGNGPYVFRIHGQVYHCTYSLHPNEKERRKYGQLYIIDSHEAVQERLNNKYNNKCLPKLLTEIDILLRDINPFAKAFKMMRDFEIEENERAESLNVPVRNIEMWIKRDRLLNQKQFNIPHCNEVAIIFVSEDGELPMERDICIHPKDSKSIPISSLSANVDPMTYPLMFPRGDPGWTVNLMNTKGTRNVTTLQYYMYRLSYRKNFNPCLRLGKLTQQFVVDVWSKVEGERLKYIRLQQTKLRAELYCGLMDYINNKAKDENIRPGKMVILPSTFIGGPRAY